MKDIGIIRNLDNMGRIVIPHDIRERLKIGEKDKIEFIIKEEKIIMRKI